MSSHNRPKATPRPHHQEPPSIDGVRAAVQAAPDSRETHRGDPRPDKLGSGDAQPATTQTRRTSPPCLERVAEAPAALSSPKRFLVPCSRHRPARVHPSLVCHQRARVPLRQVGARHRALGAAPGPRIVSSSTATQWQARLHRLLGLSKRDRPRSCSSLPPAPAAAVESPTTVAVIASSGGSSICTFGAVAVLVGSPTNGAWFSAADVGSGGVFGSFGSSATAAVGSEGGFGPPPRFRRGRQLLQLR